MSDFIEHMRRGLLLRCPVCGQGKLFRRGFKMYEQCPVCHFRFEREEGYFSSAMAIDLVLSELIVAAAIIPIAADVNIPVLPVLLIGAPFPFILPVLFYWHSRSIWMNMDHFLNPALGQGAPDPSTTYTHKPD